MFDLHDNPKLGKKILLQVADQNPAALVRLARYLRLSFSTDNMEDIAKFISKFVKGDMINE